MNKRGKLQKNSEGKEGETQGKREREIDLPNDFFSCIADYKSSAIAAPHF